MSSLHLEKEDPVRIATESGEIEGIVSQVDPFNNILVVLVNGQEVQISPEELVDSNSDVVHHVRKRGEDSDRSMKKKSQKSKKVQKYA